MYVKVLPVLPIEGYMRKWDWNSTKNTETALFVGFFPMAGEIIQSTSSTRDFTCWDVCWMGSRHHLQLIHYLWCVFNVSALALCWNLQHLNLLCSFFSQLCTFPYSRLLFSLLSCLMCKDDANVLICIYGNL